MLIKNTTGSYCKIKDIKISGTDAYITLLIHSSVPQVSDSSFNDYYTNTDRVFCFYLKDKNSTDLYKLSNNNYWIDRINNYNNDSNNIDINMHKEIILTIDITNLNRSSMQNNKWVRECNIVMLDHTIGAEEAWVSEDLTLISKEISLPELKTININKIKDNKISIKLKYLYNTQEDFKYADDNIYLLLSINSIHTKQVLESQEFYFKSIDIKDNIKIIEFISDLNYIDAVDINISLRNKKDDILSHTTKFFNPLLGNINMHLLKNKPVKIISATLKDTTLKTIYNVTLK